MRTKSTSRSTITPTLGGWDPARSTQHTALRFALGAVLLLLSVLPAFGAQNPNTSRGFTPDGVYQFNDVDSVNTFSGSVNLSIPIGQTYTAGDRLKYGLTLSYNSSLWDSERRQSGGVVRTEMLPGRTFNAGLGWTLTLGELIFHEYLRYVGPDGAEHSFKSNSLHFGTDATGGDTLYARDGSFLRLRKEIRGTEHLRHVDFPDGTSQEFLCVAPCTEPFVTRQTKFLLRKISDPFGNVVTITRPAEPFNAPWVWTVQEMSEAGQTTEHYITFEWSNHAPYTWLVKEVDLEVSTGSFTAGQPITSSRRALYTFNYYQGDLARAYRQALHTATPAMTVIQSSVNDRIFVPVLQSVTLPDTSQWQFQYHHVAPGAGSPPNANLGRPYWTSAHDKILTRVIHPTGGAIRYEWGSYLYPRRNCSHPTERDPFPRASHSTGLLRRFLVKPDGSDDGEPWRYIQNYAGGPATTPEYPYYCIGGHTFINTVVDPLANVTVNYFSVVTSDENGIPGATLRDYGLPISVADADPAGGGRVLSTRTFKCASTNPFNDAITPYYDTKSNAYDPEPVCGTPLRESYVKYESSGLDCQASGDENGPSCIGANRRLASGRTAYRDDGDAFTQTDYTDYDGLGHYRETQTRGNFYAKNGITGARPRGDLKVTRTNWNPTVQFNQAAGTFSGPPAGAWILETYNETTEEERTTVTGEIAAKGGIAKVEYHFDPANGFLTQKRVLKAGRTAADVLTTFKRVDDGAGRFRIEERYYGGDGAGLSTGALPIGSPGNADYAIDLTYRFGTLEKKEYKTCDGNTSILVTERNEIDPVTGLTMSTRHTSGAITTFLYDTMGRLVEGRPAGEALTKYAYPLASGNTPAKVTIRRVNNNDVTLQESQVEYDGWGRIAAERKRLPNLDGNNNRWSRKETTYYPNGWIRTESTYGLEGAANLGITRFVSYDPYGRPLEVEHPDSDPDARIHKTTWDYDGVRQVAKTVTGTAVNSGNYGTTVTYENFDSQGRLHMARELGQTQTIYEYDSSDRLVKVDAGTQSRTFTYDNRGFLTNEKHPELSASGVTYGSYDALGHAHDRYYGTTSNRTDLDLTFVYDAAERLRAVKQPSKNNRYLKTFDYYGGNAVARLHGKLRRTQRYNWVPDAAAVGTAERSVVVTEVYDYLAWNDRVASRRVTAPGVKMVTSYDYDPLGNVKNVVYPSLTINCDPASNAACVPVGPARTVDYEYTYGHLTKVPSYLQSLSYHPNGMVFEIWHQNNVTWVQDVPHQRHLRRPTNYRVKGTSNGQVWTTGTYKYDALANIFKIDNDTFTYDGANRLVTANMASGTQSYQYDRHGNLNNFAGTPISISNATNRLTTTGVVYDEAGNLREWVDPRQNTHKYKYTYDPFHLVKHAEGWNGTTQTFGRIHLYDADDERVAIVDYISAKPKIRETWSARDVDNQIIRDFERLYDPATSPAGASAPARGWTWKTDYILRDSLLAATVDAGGVKHVHLDHLGSPRAITNATGALIDTRNYRPFGEEVVARLDPLRVKFTGHERDDDGTTLPYGDVDYMHARYYNAMLGRFLSLDKGDDSDERAPQSWNKYTYARNNPLKYNDPDGNIIETGWDVVNLGMDVVSLGKNLAAGNWGGAAVDAVGLAVDAVATVVPGVPGGAGVAIKAARAADKVVDVARKADKVKDTARKADKVVDSAQTSKNVGRSGKQARLRELADDPKVSSRDRGEIKHDMNQMARGKRTSIRVPGNKDLAHERGREAAKGFGYEHSNLQNRDLHRLQHKHDDYGRKNKRRPGPT